MGLREDAGLPPRLFGLAAQARPGGYSPPGPPFLAVVVICAAALILGVSAILALTGFHPDTIQAAEVLLLAMVFAAIDITADIGVKFLSVHIYRLRISNLRLSAEVV